MEASTVIYGIVYGAFAVGYIAILFLTERGAAAYVSGKTRPVNEHLPIYVIADSKETRAEGAVGKRPASARILQRG